MEELKHALEGVPEEMINVTLPAPFMRDFYRDEAERVYWVDDEINASLLNLVKMIIRCNSSG